MDHGVILPLSPDAHKGSSGRVAVLGGSAMYTGAPYYAAMASLKAGADLAYVLTAQEAALPIKCYSPELMVAPVYSAADMDKSNISTSEKERLVQEMVSKVMSLIERAHCLVIGPGLGRSPNVFEAVAKIIIQAREKGLHMVVDADALFMLSLSQYRDLLHGYDKAILTPNAMEFKRLSPEDKNETVSPFEGVTIVRKGQHDIVQVNDVTEYICGETGGLKRSGGIGDVLAGTLGTLVAWHAIQSKKQGPPQQSLPLSCWTACCFVKRATANAYQQKKRSMTAPDVLDHLGSAIDEMTTVTTPATTITGSDYKT